MTHEAELMTPHGAVTIGPPSAVVINHLRSSNWAGSLMLISAVVLTAFGVALSLQPNALVWL